MEWHELEWPKHMAARYDKAVETFFAMVHCDECVNAIEAEQKSGEKYRRAIAARATSYDSGWLLRDTELHTFAKSNRRLEERTSEIESAFEWGKNWIPQAQKNCAFIEGTKGAGKSFFGHCILNAALLYGYTAREISAREIQELAMSFESKRAANRELKLIKTVGCLLVEEAGIVNWNEYGVAELREIIDYRYRNHLPMLITSNLSKLQQIELWERKCNNRSIVGPMVDRMQNFVGFQFVSDSLRKASA